MKAILIEHSPGWRVIVGPFEGELGAQEWLRTHSLSLEDAKAHILECNEPYPMQGITYGGT